MINYFNNINKNNIEQIYFNNKLEFVDPEYKFAQLLRFSQREGDNYNLDMSKTTGWGVVKYEDDLGEEFEYTLTTKEVMVNDKYN